MAVLLKPEKRNGQVEHDGDPLFACTYVIDYYYSEHSALFTGDTANFFAAFSTL